MKILFRQALTASILSAVMAVSFSACASLTVVGDLGGETTAPLFDAINAGKNNGTGMPESLPQPPASLSISNMLPVSTPEMSPGVVASRPLNLPGMPSVFVVGDDVASRQWLQQHAESLSRMQATGMVISVKDEEGLNTLRQLAPGMAMVPVSGGDLARWLGLNHYPLLITATGISQ